MRLLASAILVLALSGFATPQKAAPQKTVPDVQANMIGARDHLKAARDLAQAAGGEWGGHRMSALKHIDAALAEVDQAEKYAKAHHYIK